MQKQAGWAGVQIGYPSLSDDDVGESMRSLAD